MKQNNIFLKQQKIKYTLIEIQLVPMMDINNYNNLLYNPSHNLKIVKDTKGEYVTKSGQSWESLSLPGKKEDYVAYKIEVLEDIPTKQSLVTPWFDQLGGGVQYRFEDKILDLAKGNRKEGVKPKLKLIGEYK